MDHYPNQLEESTLVQRVDYELLNPKGSASYWRRFDNSPESTQRFLERLDNGSSKQSTQIGNV